MAVKLTLRDEEYEIRPGIALREALLKIDIQPESVLATLDGEMITDEQILRNGQVIKLIGVISVGLSP